MSQRITHDQLAALREALADPNAADYPLVRDARIDAVLSALDLQRPHPPAIIAVLCATSDDELARARVIARTLGDSSDSPDVRHVRVVAAYLTEHITDTLHGYVIPPGCNPSPTLVQHARQLVNATTNDPDYTPAC